MANRGVFTILAARAPATAAGAGLGMEFALDDRNVSFFSGANTGK
jgi:hypothetical protein